MKPNKNVLVYTDGGNTYKGELQPRTLKSWLQYGKEASQPYTYKGRRYVENGSQQVVVFDNHVWDGDELKTRKDNGFLGIRFIV